MGSLINDFSNRSKFFFKRMARTLKEKGRAALLRRNFIWECLRCCDFWGHKAKVGVDGTNGFADFRELPVKPDCPADTNETAD